MLLHERRACDCGCHGGWTQRTAETELRNIIAKVAAGVWEHPRRSAPAPVKRMPTFHEYASYWLQAHKDGVLGEKPLGKATYKDYRWRLSHLLPFFGPFLLDEIDSDMCLEFKAHKLKEATEIAEAIAAGADLRDERNRKIKPIGPSSLKRFLDTLRTILDEAIEDKYIPANPAHGRRLKVKVPKPKRTFLERDELIATEDAALSQDPSLADYHRAHREAQEGSARGGRRARALRGPAPAAGRRARRALQSHGRLSLQEVRPLGRGVRRAPRARVHPRTRGGQGQRAVRHQDRPARPARRGRLAL